MTSPNLTDEQKAVLFDKATEAPFSGALLHFSEQGKYVCANCSNLLFDSADKFDAHCGWPSFDKVVPGSVKYLQDDSHGMSRTEVVCSKCDGHLGHVFDDGPAETTGRRYCINSLSLGFKQK